MDAVAATRTASVTGNWNSTSTWGGSSVPVAGDTVIINGGINVTVTADAACASISWASPVSTVSNLTVNASYTLDVSGSIATTAGIGSKYINVYGTLKAASIDLIGNSSCIPALRIYDGGTVTIAGDLTFTGTLLTAWFHFPGSTSGTLNIGGNLGPDCYSFSAGPGTVNFNGTSAQTFAGYTYNIVKINNTAGVTPVAAPTIKTLTIADSTSGSVFNDGGYSISTATTLNLNSGTYNCMAASFPWGTLNAGTGTVNYSLSGAQTVAAKTYYNLTLSGSGNKTFSASRTIEANLEIGDSAKALLADGTSSTANSLTFKTSPQVAGTWGSSGSSADNKSDTYFVSANTGIVTVATYSGPNLYILKSADKTGAVPGEVITYTIEVKNDGTGQATTVTLTDSLGKYNALAVSAYSGSPFSFTDGSTPSGVTLGTPVYSSDNGSTWTYTLVSGAGGVPSGYDGTVTNWQIPMNVTMNGSGGGFTIKYQVIVK